MQGTGPQDAGGVAQGWMHRADGIAQGRRQPPVVEGGPGGISAGERGRPPRQPYAGSRALARRHGLMGTPSGLGLHRAGGRIGMATLTRAELREAVHRETGLPQSEAAELVETVMETIAERLTAGETVGISGFGSFRVRDKGPREGRNPRTGEPAAIPARRVVTFRPSMVLKQRIAERMDGVGDGE